MIFSQVSCLLLTLPGNPEEYRSPNTDQSTVTPEFVVLVQCHRSSRNPQGRRYSYSILKAN